MNGERVDFDELSLLEFTGVSVLYYTNTTKYSVIFNSGISVTVEGQQELLGLVTLVPTIFKGKNQEKVEEFKEERRGPKWVVDYSLFIKEEMSYYTCQRSLRSLL